jgi:hypothetical protein
MTKTFTHAGVSRLNGALKCRFANDGMRVKVLTKGGHTDIDLKDLPEAMTKSQAVEHLISSGFAKGRAEVLAALNDELTKRSPTAQSDNKVTEITLDKIAAKKVKAAKKAKDTQDLEDAAY